MSNKINIKEYFGKGTFVVPDYQRGYKWSVKKDTEESSLEFFIKSLVIAFRSELNEYFIEAVTVVEENGNIILVDGQQRTTSLFLLFVFLGEKDFVEGKLEYKVREDSHKWLNNQVSNPQETIDDEDVQDIFYFKKALIQITPELSEVENNEFLKFIKEKVYLLYNIIPKEKAVNTFIALNGLKAIMKDEELIKSDLLIKSSRIENSEITTDKAELFGIEWKVNEDRGRLARNWDKWLYWWNQEEVKIYFGISNAQHPLYYLLVTYWNINKEADNKKDFSFDNFKAEFIKDSKIAKLNFEGLRKLQKTFEDLYNDFASHNFLGLILKTINNKEDTLHYFLKPENSIQLTLEEYAKWALVGATHLEIINNTTEKNKVGETEEQIEVIIKKIKAQNAIDSINQKYVYWDENGSVFKDGRKEYAFRFLLLLNLKEDNKLKRKFDFSIWENRSLEHIYPKSKAPCLNFINEYIEGSVHCIGNLVLLYGRDNSSFGAKEVPEKKNTYFNTSIEFRSRHLLHTISVFSESDWKEKEIIENKRKTIQQIKKYYGIN